MLRLKKNNLHLNAQNSGKIEACSQKRNLGLDDNMCELFKDSFMTEFAKEHNLAIVGRIDTNPQISQV